MGKRTVLLVDDSIVIAKQLEQILNDSGSFQVVGHAKNGIEGIKLYMTLRPELVCMDLVMPEMDGLKAIRAIVGLDKNAKIIVISSTGGVGYTVMEALKIGAKNIISKPIEPDKVVETLLAVA